MSCRERERAWQRMDGVELMQNWIVQRVAVNSISWLDRIDRLNGLVIPITFNPVSRVQEHDRQNERQSRRE
jgi:hypothetical protein